VRSEDKAWDRAQEEEDYPWRLVLVAGTNDAGTAAGKRLSRRCGGGGDRNGIIKEMNGNWDKCRRGALRKSRDCHDRRIFLGVVFCFVLLVHASNPLLPNFCTNTWKKFSIEKRWVRKLEPSLSRLGRCQYLFSYETNGLFLHWTTVLHNQLGPQTLVCEVYIASLRNFIRNIVQSVLFFLSLVSSNLCCLTTRNKERAAVLATRVIACS
jgi:hypothetical protein